MVKTLQRKFIFASMFAVAILLVTLVGTINSIYCYSVYTREKSLLKLLCETDGRPEGGPGFQERGRGIGAEASGPSENAGTGSTVYGTVPGMAEGAQGEPDGHMIHKFDGGFLHRGMSMDEALSARFFAVWFDEEGQKLLADTSKIYAVSEEGACRMAQEIVGLGKTSGVYQGFRYMIAEKDMSASDAGLQMTALSPETAEQAASILVALDISADRANMLRILGISVLIALLCWAAMLVPVHALAKRAIAPTAMSIERQKQFVTNAGHELKTPLAIILANTEALELYTGESKWTRNIRAQTVRLSGLMQNLLTLSKMDENSLQLDRKPFALDLLAGEVWEDFAEPAAARNLSAQITNEEDQECRVLANRDSIAQLLSILYDNAVKYTPRGGQIEVRIVSAADGVHLIQSNSIPPEEAQKLQAGDPNRLFERFYRADSDRSRKKGGSGIGLSAARAIVGANGGSIRAEAARDKIVFTVTLKRAAG